MLRFLTIINDILCSMSHVTLSKGRYGVKVKFITHFTLASAWGIKQEIRGVAVIEIVRLNIGAGFKSFAT